jgi:hypothetical protein
VPAEDHVYQFDGAGFVGFHIIDGDGLNTREYAKRAAQRTLTGYLDEEGICFVIDNVKRGLSDVIVDYGGLRVRRSELDEVFRARTFGQHPTTDFVYRRRTESCRRKDQQGPRSAMGPPADRFDEMYVPLFDQESP